MLSIRYKFRCADMFCSFEPNLLKCLWPYVWPNISGKDLPIYSFELCILKLCISMVKFIKIFYTCSLLYHHWSSFCIKEEDKKGVSLSFREIPLQNQGQGRFSTHWSLCFLWHQIYISDLILFGNIFGYSNHFWAWEWKVFLFLL